MSKELQPKEQKRQPALFEALLGNGSAQTLGDSSQATQDSPVTQSQLKELFPEIIGESQAMQDVLRLVLKVAQSDSAVLIMGESGTGKELIASAIHRFSNRSSGPFMPLNCSAFPEQLLESQLFGYSKGAFTGAAKRHTGIIEASHNGTVFLDEIGDMPLNLQSKILRVLQEKKYLPLGENTEKYANIRILAATNCDLMEEVKQKKFRLDLYYRLNVIPVQLPALRDRKSDIPRLIEHFLKLAVRTHKIKGSAHISNRSIEKMTKYSWPGNVRQLQNIIERMVVISSGGVIGDNMLPEEIEQYAGRYADEQQSSSQARNQSISLPFEHAEGTPESQYLELLNVSAGHGDFKLNEYLMNLENNFIAAALKKSAGNKNQAAKLLGINRTTLVEKVKKRKIIL